MNAQTLTRSRLTSVLHPFALALAIASACVAQQFVQIPYSTKAALGYPVTLTTAATGSGELAYQWLQDGAPIPGANTNTYVIPALERWTEGSYTVVISNAFGSVTSAPPAQVIAVAPYRFSTLLNLHQASAVALDKGGNIYATGGDFISGIIRLAPDGTQSHFPATFALTESIAADSRSNLFICDLGSSCIVKVFPNGTVTNFAGNLHATGTNDGKGPAALFNNPYWITVDAFDNLFVSDAGNSTIRKITPDGTVTTYAGAAGDSRMVDGPAPVARFVQPGSLAIDSKGTLYVFDQKFDGNVNPSGPYADSAAIRMVTPDGSVSTLVGPYSFSNVTNNGAPGSEPLGPYLLLAVDPQDSLWAIDSMAIRQVTPDGFNPTVAGQQNYGYVDGVGVGVRFNNPGQMAFAADGTLYVADTGNNCVRKGVPVSLLAPQLEIAAGSTPGSVDLTWTVEPGGFQLESSAGLLGTPSWATQTNVTTSPGGLRNWTTQTTNAPAFFRLVETNAP